MFDQRVFQSKLKRRPSCGLQSCCAAIYLPWLFAPFIFRPQEFTPRIIIELHQAVEPKVATMRKLFRCKRMPQTPRTPPALHCTLPTPATVLQPFVTAGPVHDQSQSIVLDKLSAEIRLLIYEAVLTDPTRLLHISFFSKSEGMGHWRCEDIGSPFPTWQHRCFGIYNNSDKSDNSGRYHRTEPRSSDNQMNLLLTCRRIYLESIETLYTKNDFSFKGAAGLLRFRSRLPVNRWQNLRRLHISTVFRTPIRLAPYEHVLLPEIYEKWGWMCAALSDLDKLKVLFIEFTIWNFYDYETSNTPDNDALLAILQSLRSVKAVEFEVEMNMGLSKEVKEALGPVRFKMTHKQRPYNSAVFARY